TTWCTTARHCPRPPPRCSPNGCCRPEAERLAELVEGLLPGQLLGLVGEAVPGGFLLDEDLQVEVPGLLAVQQADRDGIEVVGLEAVVLVRAALAAEAALGAVGGAVDARGTALDRRRLAAVHHQQGAAGPLAAHAAVAGADVGVVHGDAQLGGAA